MTAYKQKLKRSDERLDIIDKLYHKKHQSRESSANRSLQLAPKSKRKQTEILMRRIQMSSCRKRRNKQMCLFDPQRIVDFARTTTFS
ncbi:MAG: hypothetical protein JST59_02605 [Actinobacteria bacterium]|nr:hypothetical protein [Actinomycetota bacterium]